MNNELIERIKTGIKNVSGWTPLSKHKRQLLHDCEAEIKRLELLLTTQGKVNLALSERVSELESELAEAKEYVPMTDDEFHAIWIASDGFNATETLQLVEAEVIKRAGLIVKEKE